MDSASKRHVSNENNSGTLMLSMRASRMGRHFLAYFFIAYMDVGKGREQDAEALL